MHIDMPRLREEGPVSLDPNSLSEDKMTKSLLLRLRALNLVVSLITAFDITYLFFGPWVVAQFLNGRQWFADEGVNFIKADTRFARMLADWQSLWIPIWLVVFAVLAFLAHNFFGLSGAIAVRLAVMAGAHLIGYGWYKIVVPYFDTIVLDD